MCGIAGLIGSDPKYAKAHLPKMVQHMHHRGPDGQGFWYDDSVALGHARLAIIDTSDAGAQPMHHNNGHIHLVVNGEIYNYPQLRRELEETYAIECQSDCDSEILLHGYAHEGIPFFTKLNGMFAAVLYDAKTQQCHFLRDRIGIKPLYYTRRNEGFAFASEIKSLLAAYDVQQWDIDRQALGEYLAYQTPMQGRSLFQDVSLLQPGHHMVVDCDGVIISNQCFWTTQEKLLNITHQGAVDQFRDVFRDSVSRHLLSDVPVATYLSAGFDSSSVAVNAAQISGLALHSYTGAFGQDGSWYDEAAAAKTAVDSYQGHHHVVSITSDDFTRHFDDVIHALDEPRMGMGAFPQYMVAKAAARDFKVILTGHGGDELFSGYPIFKLAHGGWCKNFKLSELPHMVYFALSALKGKIWREYGRHMPVLWDSKAQNKLLTKRGDQNIYQALQDLQKPHRKTIDQIYQTYLNVYLPNLLIVEDKISMAHALESRTPFLDNQMLDLSLSIPQGVKLQDGVLKSIVKQAGRTLLPEEFYTQPKRGFPTPLRQWLRGPLSGMIEERLLGETPLHRIMHAQELNKIIADYRSSWRRHIRPLDEIQSHRIWQLLSLDSWMRGWERHYGVTLT